MNCGVCGGWLRQSYSTNIDGLRDVACILVGRNCMFGFVGGWRSDSACVFMILVSELGLGTTCLLCWLFPEFA